MGVTWRRTARALRRSTRAALPTLSLAPLAAAPRPTARCSAEGEPCASDASCCGGAYCQKDAFGSALGVCSTCVADKKYGERRPHPLLCNACKGLGGCGTGAGPYPPCTAPPTQPPPCAAPPRPPRRLQGQRGGQLLLALHRGGLRAGPGQQVCLPPHVSAPTLAGTLFEPLLGRRQAEGRRRRRPPAPTTGTAAPVPPVPPPPPPPPGPAQLPPLACLGQPR